MSKNTRTPSDGDGDLIRGPDRETKQGTLASLVDGKQIPGQHILVLESDLVEVRQ